MSLRGVVLGLAALGVAGAGCGESAASAGSAGAVSPVSSATTDCLELRSTVAQSWGPVRAVAGAFSVPAHDVAAWQETRHLSSGIRRESLYRSRGAEPMLVCFFDGDFDHFPGKGRRLPYDRIVVIFDATRQPTLDSAGPHDHLKVERPGPRP